MTINTYPIHCLLEKNSFELLEELEALSEIQESDSHLFWNEESVEEIVYRRELRRVLEEGFSKLTEREENVIRFRFGFDDEIERTLEKVGRIFGVTRERVRQIESKALRRLKAILSEWKVEMFLGDDFGFRNSVTIDNLDEDTICKKKCNNDDADAIR